MRNATAFIVWVPDPEEMSASFGPIARRRELAVAFAHDTVGSLRGSPYVGDLHIISAASLGRHIALAHGIPFHQGGRLPLIGTSMQWVRRLLHPATGPAGVVRADLPALSGPEIATCVLRSEKLQMPVVVHDRGGRRTSLILDQVRGRPFFEDPLPYEMPDPLPGARAVASSREALRDAYAIGLGAHTQTALGRPPSAASSQEERQHEAR